jgi:hypothetical protein
MEKEFLDTGDGKIDNRTAAVKCLFRKVFHCPDGRRVISELKRRTRLSPKSDLEYAKLVGMQLVMDIICDMAEFFWEETYD